MELRRTFSCAGPSSEAMARSIALPPASSQRVPSSSWVIVMFFICFTGPHSSASCYRMDIFCKKDVLQSTILKNSTWLVLGLVSLPALLFGAVKLLPSMRRRITPSKNSNFLDKYIASEFPHTNPTSRRQPISLRQNRPVLVSLPFPELPRSVEKPVLLGHDPWRNPCRSRYAYLLVLLVLIVNKYLTSTISCSKKIKFITRHRTPGDAGRREVQGGNFLFFFSLDVFVFFFFFALRNRTWGPGHRAAPPHSGTQSR